MVLPGQKPRGVYKRRCIVALHSSVCYSWDLFLFFFSRSTRAHAGQTGRHNRGTNRPISLDFVIQPLSLSLSIWYDGLTRSNCCRFFFAMLTARWMFDAFCQKRRKKKNGNKIDFSIGWLPLFQFVDPPFFLSKLQCPFLYIYLLSLILSLSISLFLF
jgi:hypothetical protein